MSDIVRAARPRENLSSGVRTVAVPIGAPRNLEGPALVARFEAAGATLLALSVRGYSTALRQSRYDIVRSALDAYGYQPERLRPPAPEPGAITAMDEAYGWLLGIPEERYMLRRIVGARSLVHPITGRHLYPWRRLAAGLGADHRAVQRWHAEGIRIIGAYLSESA